MRASILDPSTVETNPTSILNNKNTTNSNQQLHSNHSFSNLESFFLVWEMFVASFFGKSQISTAYVPQQLAPNNFDPQVGTANVETSVQRRPMESTEVSPWSHLAKRWVSAANRGFHRGCFFRKQNVVGKKHDWGFLI